MFFLKQIMNGFQELRRNNILHRDFKLANIFLNDETLLIGDFGFAKVGDLGESIIGTPLTSSYEILIKRITHSNSTYDSKADLWSVGVVYYQMLYGEYPFMAQNLKGLIQDIQKKCKDFTFPDSVKVS